MGNIFVTFRRFRPGLKLDDESHFRLLQRDVARAYHAGSICQSGRRIDTWSRRHRQWVTCTLPSNIVERAAENTRRRASKALGA